MPTQRDLDETYLRMALQWSTLSRARRKKVGCLIVKDGAIISDGYNGTPQGFDNNCEDEVYEEDLPLTCATPTKKLLITKSEVLHAESNAITKLAKSTQSSMKATMYITISPCVECAKLIIQSGIQRVVYSDFYRDNKGIQLLRKAHVKVDQKKLDNLSNL